MTVLFYALMFMVAAGLAHIVSLFALADLSGTDAHARLAAIAPENSMRVVGPARETGLPFAEPAVVLALCRYDLSRGPLRVAARTGDTFVSLTFIEPGSRVFHGLTDRTAAQGTVEVVLATPAQLRRISALDAPDDIVQEIRVIAPQPHGMVIVRALHPFASQRGETERTLSQATCEIEQLPE